MCLASAFLTNWNNEPILQDIALVQLHGDNVEMKTLLGEGKIISGKVVTIDFAKAKILLMQNSEASGD